MIGWPRTAHYYDRNSWAGQLTHEGRWVLDGPATNATAHYLTNMLYLAGAARPGGAEIEAVRAELYRSKEISSYDTSCIEVSMSGGARLLHYVSHSLSETMSPSMDIDCERGSIHWEAGDDVAVISYTDGRSETIANADPARNHERPFEQVAQVVAGDQAAVLCGLEEGGAHVLAIDLAFESSGGIMQIPSEFAYQRTGDDGAALDGVVGMAGLLKRVQAEGGMFSDQGVPWARSTDPVPSEGYEHFPSPRLERSLLGRV